MNPNKWQQNHLKSLWCGTDKARFMNIAQGSLEECQYYLILSKDLGYGKNDASGVLLNDVGRMLQAYRNKILTADS